MKPKLVTVTGHRTNTLWHQLNHYKDMVSDIFVITYENEDSPKNIKGEVEYICKQFGITPHTVRTHRPFDWEYVTQLYNETKMLHPNDWWIVSDDDEFQIYNDLVENIIDECEEFGYKFVTGGFIDRIGFNGDFPKIKEKEDIWKQFPMAGFFRYPMSGACPNKVTLMKGWVELTPGQHYAKIDGQTTWRWQGWNHPLRYPVDRNFTQVHHFKWDSTVIDRLQDVANIGKVYAFSKEYKEMYEALKENNFMLDIYDKKYMFEEINKIGYHYYKSWGKLSKIIQSI
jgi:hypothetical protein